MNDWDEVTVLRKKPTSSKDAKSATAVNRAMRTGDVETAKKCMFKARVFEFFSDLLLF